MTPQLYMVAVLVPIVGILKDAEKSWRSNPIASFFHSGTSLRAFDSIILDEGGQKYLLQFLHRPRTGCSQFRRQKLASGG
jgi:hypothetical protein